MEHLYVNIIAHLKVCSCKNIRASKMLINFTNGQIVNSISVVIVPVSISSFSRGRDFTTWRFSSVFKELNWNIAVTAAIQYVKMERLSYVLWYIQQLEYKCEIRFSTHHPLIPTYRPKSMAACASSRVPSKECICRFIYTRDLCLATSALMVQW